MNEFDVINKENLLQIWKVFNYLQVLDFEKNLIGCNKGNFKESGGSRYYRICFNTRNSS